MKNWDIEIKKLLNGNELKEWKAARNDLISTEELRLKMLEKIWNIENQIEELNIINCCIYENNLKVLSKLKNNFFKINLSKKLINLNKKEVELCDNIEFLKELKQQKFQYDNFLQKEKFDINFREKERKLWNLILNLYFIDKNNNKINSNCYKSWSNNFIEICKKIENQITDLDIKDNIIIISDTVSTLIEDIQRDDFFVKNQNIIINDSENNIKNEFKKIKMIL